MWEFDPTEDYLRRFKRYAKKHPRELEAVLANLTTLQDALREGMNPSKLPFGFLHIEPRGIVAIDQKGGGKDLAQTRLYIYLNRKDKTIHLLTLGGKDGQRADIKVAAGFIDELIGPGDRGENGKENPL